ncbi:amine sulfotransferase-like isoform X1 [Dermacentor andersoni]|uniref:amine sulfotransferase-like isoform X1 n=1 Tax=Dermacentor andersoni TaxID=34620 RepID=UPI002417B715|nr:amine sulfotransferase-like isoform X1 [Dermacentor andersoni]
MVCSKRPFTQDIDGDLYNINFNPDIIREALAFKPRPGDVIEVSYPSSGTRWMQHMIQLIVYKGNSANSHNDFLKRYVVLELLGKRMDLVKSTPRLILTHMRPGKLAIMAEAKYVYVARNPWDVCWSSYCLAMKLRELSERMSFDDYVSMFLDGRVGVGPYFEHVHAGYVRRTDPNFFFVTYEEMVTDCGGVVLRLADFLDGDYGEWLRRNPELLGDVVRKCSVPYVSALISIPKEQFIKMVFTNPNVSQETALRRAEDMEETVSAVRKAKIGNWRDAFSKAALRMTLEKINSTPKAAFVQELWKDIFAEVVEAAT